MQCYTELVPPTGVTHALSLPFTSPNASNLLVAKTSVLQVFALKAVDNGNRTRLVLVSEHHVAGTITALSRVKVLNSKSGGEAVLIAVRDAKLSLVEWNPELHSISTVSIHYYESEDLQKNPWAPHLTQCASHLTVDPSSRCAAFNFGVQNLAILPFHQIGDDLVMDEYGRDPDEEKPESNKPANGDATAFSTPYASSFVLSLTTLDPGILHPIDLAFLHEYREPTFGILYTSSARSQALAYERKDNTHYAVFTLDLDQKASTTLLSISKLPNDLYRVIPLPPPVGGSLLLGSNEIVHVDQGGKTNAIGVNEFSRRCSAFSMADGSDLKLKLEGSEVVGLGAPSTDLLLVLANGGFALISFKLDGRTVSSVQLRPIDANRRPPFLGAASCLAVTGLDQLFIGSEEADSLLVRWEQGGSSLKRQTSRATLRANETIEMNGDGDIIEDDEAEEDDLDEDLYGPSEGNQTQRTRSIDASTGQDINIQVLDRLLSIADIRDTTFGVPRPRVQDSTADLELALATGRAAAGSISILSREVDLNPRRPSLPIDGATGVWSVQVKGRNTAADEVDQRKNYDQFMIVAAIRTSGEEQSDLYRITSDSLETIQGTEFDPSAGATVAVGTIADGTRIIQALSGELRSYDSSFALSQIHPIVDEDTGELAGVASVRFADPFVLVLRHDSTVILLQADKSGDLEEVDLPNTLSDCRWVSACLYADVEGIFGDQGGTVIFLLGAEGNLSVFSASALNEPIYIHKGLHFLPSRLTNEPLPKHWRQHSTLVEILVADLGDQTTSSPYMILRTSTDELVVYEPYRLARDGGSRSGSGAIAFKRLPNRLIAKSPVTASEDAAEADTVQHNKALTALSNFGGLKTIMMPGTSPALLARDVASSPQAYNLRAKAVRGLTSFHTEECPDGIAYIDHSSTLQIVCPSEAQRIGHLPWVVIKKHIGLDVSQLTFFPRTGSYVLAASESAEFQLPQDDEWHPEWQEEQTAMKPRTERSFLKVLSRKSFNVLGTYTFDPDETVMSLKTINLEVSDETHDRKDLIVVGTAITRGEDVSARGALYIFDIVDVVPEPGVDETDLKLKLLAKEDVKGAVTALSQIGSQGYLIASQGQKCMVRGLKDDNTILPVAFLDMNYYVNVIKELKGTGLCILGDGCHGLWFTGYSVSTSAYFSEPLINST